MARLKITPADFVRTGPGTLAGRYLRTFWHPVYRAQDLPPGRAVPLRILGEDFTLYRGEDGTPHLVGFRCAHRGTQLSVGWVEGNCIRCFYHGWKYEASGQCIEQPAEPEPFAHKVRIPAYPVREYIGFLFAYLGEGDPPPFPRYPSFEAPDAVLIADAWHRPCNFFQNVENSVDTDHVAFVHRDGVGSAYEQFIGVERWAEESSWGITNYTRLKDGRVRKGEFGMPNINYIFSVPREGVGRLETLLFKVPIDDTHHMQFEVHKVPLAGGIGERYVESRRVEEAKITVPRSALREAIFAGRLRLMEVEPGRLDYVELQDDLAQVGQGVIADRRQERLGRGDVGVILLRKLWARELRALAEGWPLKQWTRLEDMVPTNR